MDEQNSSVQNPTARPPNTEVSQVGCSHAPALCGIAFILIRNNI